MKKFLFKLWIFFCLAFSAFALIAASTYGETNESVYDTMFVDSRNI